MLPHAPHAREVVLELCELDLELALGADRVLGEDVEDQLRPVDDSRGERVLEPPLLGWAQLVVDEQRLGLRVTERALQLDELAFADIGALVGPRAPLDDLRHRVDACRPGKLAELAQLLVGIDVRAQHGDDESPLRIRTGSRVRLVLSHDRIMTSALVIRSTASSRRESGTVSESLT